MPLESELRDVIGALQSEVDFEAVVSELGAAGIDRARISFLAQEDIAAFCAPAVGCDIKQLPRVEISLSDDRQQVRTLETSLAATVASSAPCWRRLAERPHQLCWRGWLPAVVLAGWQRCSGSDTKATCTSGPRARSSTVALC